MSRLLRSGLVSGISTLARHPPSSTPPSMTKMISINMFNSKPISMDLSAAVSNTHRWMSSFSVPMDASYQHIIHNPSESELDSELVHPDSKPILTSATSATSAAFETSALAWPTWSQPLRRLVESIPMLDSWLLGVPKKRTTRRTIRMRNFGIQKLIPFKQNLIECELCGRAKMPHTYCSPTRPCRRHNARKLEWLEMANEEERSYIEKKWELLPWIKKVPGSGGSKSLDE